jgi:hypothetical protein
MRAKLTRISSNHRNVRTDKITGEIDRFPCVGDAFALIGDPLVRFAQFRLITTTRVARVEKKSDREYEFWTRNSHYSLGILEEVH